MSYGGLGASLWPSGGGVSFHRGSGLSLNFRKEGRASASHGNGRNGHSVHGAEAMFFALSVVELEGSYSLCYDLGFCISPVAEGLIFNKYKKNESWAMDQTHICLSKASGFTTNGEGDDVTHRYSGATFVES